MYYDVDDFLEVWGFFVVVVCCGEFCWFVNCEVYEKSDEEFW